jgi:hypothetical protein
MANTHGISQKVIEHLPLVENENMFKNELYMVSEVAYIKGLTIPEHPVGVMGRDKPGNRIYICDLIESADNDFEGTMHGMLPASEVRAVNIIYIKGYLPLSFK